MKRNNQNDDNLSSLANGLPSDIIGEILGNFEKEAIRKFASINKQWQKVVKEKFQLKPIIRKEIKGLDELGKYIDDFDNSNAVDIKLDLSKEDFREGLEIELDNFLKKYKDNPKLQNLYITSLKLCKQVVMDSLMKGLCDNLNFSKLKSLDFSGAQIYDLAKDAINELLKQGSFESLNLSNASSVFYIDVATKGINRMDFCDSYIAKKLNITGFKRLNFGYRVEPEKTLAIEELVISSSTIEFNTNHIISFLSALNTPSLTSLTFINDVDYKREFDLLYYIISSIHFKVCGTSVYNNSLTKLNLVGFECRRENFSDGVKQFMERNPKLSLTFTDCTIDNLDKIFLEKENNRIKFNSSKEQANHIAM